jgi:hypothetical protein
MLKINSPLFKLITILFRQMNLSIGRYSEEEDFYAYFKDKHIYYKYAIAELEKVLYESSAYSSFGEMVKKTFFTRQLRYLYILLVYKVLKEFDEMLDSREFDYMLREKKTNLSSGEIYWGLLRKKIPRKERKIIDETEHFGQNLMFSHYKSIERTLSQLNVQIEINGK